MPEQASVRLVDAVGVVDPLVGGLGQAVDGTTVAPGNEILLINPPNGDAYAGPYVAAAGAWPRRDDWQNVVEMSPGDWWRIREGTQYQGTAWAFENTSPPATINVTPLTIGLWTRRREAEAGGGIDITGTTPPIISWNAPSDVESTFIEGLRPVYLSANSLRIESGATYIPQTGVADMDSDTDLTGLTLGANSWVYLYGYDAGGSVLAIDPPSTQAPNTVPYRGGARSKGPDAEPDLTRRHLGARRVGAANTFLRWHSYLNGEVHYDENPLTTLQLFSGLSAQTFTERSFSALVPPTSRYALLRFETNANSGVEIDYDTVAGSGWPLKLNFANNVWVGWLQLTSTQTLRVRNAAASGSTDISVLGFYEER